MSDCYKTNCMPASQMSVSNAASFKSLLACPTPGPTIHARETEFLTGSPFSVGSCALRKGSKAAVSSRPLSGPPNPEQSRCALPQHAAQVLLPWPLFAPGPFIYLAGISQHISSHIVHLLAHQILSKVAAHYLSTLHRCSLPGCFLNQALSYIWLVFHRIHHRITSTLWPTRS